MLLVPYPDPCGPCQGTAMLPWQTSNRPQLQPFRWPPEPALPTFRAGWKCQGISTSFSTKSNSQPITMGHGVSIEKDPDAGEDSRQEEKGMTEDKTVGRRH